MPWKNSSTVYNYSPLSAARNLGYSLLTAFRCSFSARVGFNFNEASTHINTSAGPHPLEILKFPLNIPLYNTSIPKLYAHTVSFSSVLALNSHEAFPRNLFHGFVFFSPVKWGLSLSHNSTQLFILNFSCHSSTLVLLFKMFVHQMFVLPSRHMHRYVASLPLIVVCEAFLNVVNCNRVFLLIKCLDGYSFFNLLL